MSVLANTLDTGGVGVPTKVSARISAVSSYLPRKILTNDDLSKMVDTTDEWITTRTGIKQRHICGEGETTSDMVVSCVNDLIAKNSIDPLSVDLIMVATTTPDFSFPSVAAIVQGKCDLKNAPAFDLSAACAGFLYGLSVANNLIKSGQYRRIILVGADKNSSIVNWKDRSTCVLFGDGAGAVLLDATEDSGIIASKLYADGSGANVNILKAKLFGGSIGIEMTGTEVFKHAVSKMCEATREILLQNNIALNDIKAVIPHQANKRIIDAMAERLGIDKSMIVITVDKHANTSAASIPLALANAVDAGKIKTGDLFLMVAIGAGLTWGVCIGKL